MLDEDFEKYVFLKQPVLKGFPRLILASEVIYLIEKSISKQSLVEVRSKIL